jgi:signal transduction histidine kinase
MTFLLHEYLNPTNLWESFLGIYIQGNLGYSFLVSQVLMAIILNLLLNERWRTWKDVLVHLAEMAVSLLFMIFVSSFIYLYIFLDYQSALFTYVDLPPFLFVLVFTVYTILVHHQKAFNEAMVSVLYYCLFLSATYLSGYFGTCQDYHWFIGYPPDLTMISTILTQLGIGVFMYFLDFKKTSFIPKFSLILAVVYLLFCYTLFTIFRIFVLRGTGDSYYWVFLIIYSLLLFIGLMMDFVFYSIAKEHNKLMNAEIINQNQKDNEKLMELAQSNDEQIHRIRHDMKNQYAVMSLLLKEKKYDELSKYFDDYSKNVLPAISSYNTGNKVIDSILNLEKAKADHEQLALDCKASVPPELPIEASDLSSLITNILDNAMEACVSGHFAKAAITLEIHLRESYLIIEETNPTDHAFSAKDLDSFRTSKKDIRHHGFGLKIIKSIVLKYHGGMTAAAENGTFRFSAMLALGTPERK